jgi:outer membrane immunogenic protein
MKRSLFGIAAIFAMIGTPVLAADMPLKAPPPPPAWSWTGFYLGFNGGYGWSGANTVTLSELGVTVPGVVGPGSANGGFGGGQIGYNWQIKSFVLGAEADIEGANIRHSSGSNVVDAAGDVALSNQNLNSFYTLRGRAGFAFDRTLVYFTGGFAGGRVITDTILVTNPTTTAFANLTDATSRSGYVLGGGLEYAFDRHWSLKAEYQYLNLGSGILSGPIVNPAPGVSITSTTVKDNFQTVRGGVNYHF